MWKVEVQASDPKLNTATRIEVAPGRNGKATVEIRLPDTYVFGRVVDEAGRPVSGAHVALSSLEGRVTAESGAAGEFDLYAVPEGKSRLKASLKSHAEGELTSDVLSIEALDSLPVGPLTLTLRKTRVLTGRVQSLRGPVAGAVLRFQPLRPALGITASTQSELDGSFSVNLDGKAESMAAIVSPPGHSFQVFEVPVNGEPVLLNVSDEGGLLEVALPFSLKDSNGVNLIVLQNQLTLPIPSLYLWATGHGLQFEDAAGLHIPRLAPGEYEACLGPLTLEELAAWKARPEVRCASGSLANGGALRLDLSTKAGTGR